MYKKLMSVGSSHKVREDGSEDASQGPPKAKRQEWKGVMGGQKFEIWLASALVILPMVALSMLLVGLIYAYQMPDRNSSYSTNNGTALPLGWAYYVDYSSTTLVYLASISSTLATLLISAAMLLYSFSIAHNIARNSDQNTPLNLPSPYQLELLIRLIEGRLLVIWSYVPYVFGSKQRRTTLAPVLRQAMVRMVVLILLAILIGLADLWLHVTTKSVQYTELRPESLSKDFMPGRGLNPTCLSNPIDIFNTSYNSLRSCIAHPPDAANSATLVNSTEFFRTASNYSSTNHLYLSDGFAVLGPAEPPSDVDFQAISFGSKSKCKVVTGLCGATSTTGNRYPKPSMSNFVCNSTMAGLNMTGNFENVLAPLNSSGLSTGPPITNLTDPESSSIPALVVLGENTMAPNNFLIGLQYFFDTQKLNKTSMGGPQYGLSSIPASSNPHELHWAMAWRLPFITPLTIPRTGQNWTMPEPKDIAAIAISTANDGGSRDNDGGSQGLLSCDTEISEVTYSITKGKMSVISSRIPTPNATVPFVNGVSWGYEQLHQGLEQSFAAASSPEDFSSRFATFYDQILLSVPAGVILQKPALNTSRRVETQVTRVPKAPFWALVLLDLLYAALGLVLTVTALLAMFRGRGVRDAQARLSLAAIVAESFESPGLGDDAKEVDELFAERRGLATRRVALTRREDGGRRYRHVIQTGEDQQGFLR